MIGPRFHAVVRDDDNHRLCPRGRRSVQHRADERIGSRVADACLGMIWPQIVAQGVAFVDLAEEEPHCRIGGCGQQARPDRLVGWIVVSIEGRLRGNDSARRPRDAGRFGPQYAQQQVVTLDCCGAHTSRAADVEQRGDDHARLAGPARHSARTRCGRANPMTGRMTPGQDAGEARVGRGRERRAAVGTAAARIAQGPDPWHHVTREEVDRAAVDSQQKDACHRPHPSTENTRTLAGSTRMPRVEPGSSDAACRDGTMAQGDPYPKIQGGRMAATVCDDLHILGTEKNDDPDAAAGGRTHRKRRSEADLAVADR